MDLRQKFNCLGLFCMLSTLFTLFTLSTLSTLFRRRVLDEHLTRLAGFKVPKRVILVESLPKNPSGKLLKRELRSRYTG